MNSKAHKYNTKDQDILISSANPLTKSTTPVKRHPSTTLSSPSRQSKPPALSLNNSDNSKTLRKNKSINKKSVVPLFSPAYLAKSEKEKEAKKLSAPLGSPTKLNQKEDIKNLVKSIPQTSHVHIQEEFDP